MTAAGTRILVIDDDRALRGSIRDYLEDREFEVTTAENGRQGLEYFRHHRPDLVLTDLRMPEVDGLGVLKWLDAHDPEMPVVVFSGTGDISQAVDALKMGAWDYILKPVRDMQVITQAIQRGLERAQRKRESRAYRANLETLVAARTSEVQQGREFLQAIIDSISDVLLVVNPDKTTALTNRAGQDATIELGAGGGAKLIEDVISQQRPCLAQHVHRTKSGDEIPYEVAAAPLFDDAGTIAQVVLLFRDVSERVQAAEDKDDLERRLRQSEKMDAIGQLAGGVAHDFNNMLGGILGAADLIKERLPADAKTRQYHTMIVDAALRAAELTHKLLSFARPQSEASVPTDLHDVLTDTIALLKNTIDRRICCVAEFSAEDSWVNGDPAHLQSAFLNLGINAAQAMAAGGEITFATRTIVLDDRDCAMGAADLQPGSYVELTVSDSGQGISEQNLPHVFDPFFTTKAPGKGTGLGLPAVLNTVKRHKGGVTVDSVPDVGTQFVIRLPLRAASLRTRAQGEEVMRGSGTILLVEDEAVVRTTAAAMLGHLGYEVVEADNGRRGLLLFEQEPDRYDLVLLDMIMPQVNGQDCFAAMRTLRPQVRILISSGFTIEEQQQSMLATGPFGLIRKPYTRIELSRAVHDALAGSPAP